MQDCIVIGGGLIGMLTARELAIAGVRVHLIERGAIGQEASWAGGGILSPLYPWRYGDAVSRLAAWGQPRYRALARELEAESGVDPEWTPSGMLLLDVGDETDAEAWSGRFDVKLERVASGGCQILEPGLALGDAVGVWMPQVAQVRNPRLVQALRGALASHGISSEEHTPVESVLIESGRVCGVRVAGQVRPAERVIIAGGAWSGELLRRIGRALPIEPVRGQMMVFRAEPGVARHIILNEGRYLIPRRDGHVLVGSTLERVGYDKSTTDEARRSLYQAAVDMVPALAGYPVERHWSGLRPGSPDGVPFIGKVRNINGLYVNSGHFRNGVVLGPASARLLADLLLGRDPIVDPEPYRAALSATVM